MQTHILDNPDELGQAAAVDGARAIHEAITRQGQARIIVATGASQFEFLGHLVRQPGIDWSLVTMFHLDEYIGLPASHPASFRRYLHERLTNLVHPGTTVWIDGEATDPRDECRRVGDLIAAAPVDVAFVGIGENGHLAFNDPPADFEINDPFIIVDLDEACRRQQAGEGWFTSPDAVPSQAISMSIREIMRARKVICNVPDRRKAAAVRACLEEDVSPLRPASILRQHPDATLYLDRDSAALLTHPSPA